MEGILISSEQIEWFINMLCNSYGKDDVKDRILGALEMLLMQERENYCVLKSQESNFNNDIERIVKMYDVNGQLIAQYDGKFDIACNGDRILFDDKNGKKHIVHYPTGAVVIDEK